MRPESTTSEATAVTLPYRVIGVISLAALVTASPDSSTALDQGVDVERSVFEETASASPPSGLPYTEMTALRRSEVAVGEVVVPAVSSVDPKELLGRRILSFTSELAAVPEGTAVSREAIADALRFLDLLPTDSQVPHVSIADDGEVNFFRRRPGLYIDVGFFGDGEIHYYARVETLGIDVARSCPFDGRSLPHELVAPLTTE